MNAPSPSSVPPTPTPDDLLAIVARAITPGASLDERRAGRQACAVLAASLGDPGQPMAPGAAANPRPRLDGAQLLDLAIAKLQAVLAAHAEREAAAAPTPTAPAATSPPGSSSTAAPPPRRNAAPPTAPTTSRRPRAPGLRIPLVGAGTIGR